MSFFRVPAALCLSNPFLTWNRLLSSITAIVLDSNKQKAKENGLTV